MYYVQVFETFNSFPLEGMREEEGVILSEFGYSGAR